MTYGGNDGAVPELKLRVSDENGDSDYYVKIGNDEGSSEDGGCLELGEFSEPSTPRIRRAFFCKWIKFFFLFAVSAGLAIVFFKWVGPFSMDKVPLPHPTLRYIYRYL